MVNSLLLQGSMKLQGEYIAGYSLDLTNWLNRLKYYGLPWPSNTVISAVNALLAGLGQTGIRSKIKRLNLFCAGDWIGSFFPLIIDVGNMWDYNAIHGSTVADLFNGPIQAADWSLTSGYNFVSNAAYWPNVVPGVNGNLNTNQLKVIDTTYPENDPSLANYDAHIACFISDINNSSPISTYCTDIGGDATYFDFQCSYNGNNTVNNIVRFNCYTQSLTDTAGGVTPYNTPQGFYIGSRLSSTLNTMYKAGYYQNLPIINSGSNPNYSTMISTPSTSFSSMILGGKTNGSNISPGSNRVVNNVTDRTYSMYSIGDGLTDDDALKYNNLIIAFNKSIGRTNY